MLKLKNAFELYVVIQGEWDLLRGILAYSPGTLLHILFLLWVQLVYENHQQTILFIRLHLNLLHMPAHMPVFCSWGTYIPMYVWEKLQFTIEVRMVTGI